MSDNESDKKEMTAEEIMELLRKLPKIEFWFNCQGDCLTYENGILIGKQRIDGKYIDYRKHL